MVTVTASTAVAFLILDERRRGRWQYRGATSDQRNSQQTSSNNWYNRIFGERNRDLEKETTTRGKQGWIPARTAEEWDDASDDSCSRRKTKSPVPSVGINTLEYTPSVKTVKYSQITSPQRSHSLASERSSNLVHGVRGLVYPDLYAPSPQRPIPSIHSQLYSPPSSPPSSVQHEPAWVLSTVAASPVLVSRSPIPMSVSPESFEEYSAELHLAPHNDRKSSSTSVPSVRTFEGGTKFIEGF